MRLNIKDLQVMAIKKKTIKGYSIYLAIKYLNGNTGERIVSEEFQTNFRKETIANNLVNFLNNSKDGILKLPNVQKKLFEGILYNSLSSFYNFYKADFFIKFPEDDQEGVVELKEEVVLRFEEKKLEKRWYVGNIQSYVELQNVRDQGFTCIKGDVNLYRELVNHSWGEEGTTPKEDWKDLTELGLLEITGYLNIGENKLESLKGAPVSTGSFYCSNNQLSSLEGIPKEIKGHLFCSNNNLLSLQAYYPYTLDGSVECERNKLESLKGLPDVINGSLYVSHNLLKTLKDGPSVIKEHFICINNQLTNLQGIAKKIGRQILIQENKLTDVKGLPTKVKGDLSLAGNELTQLKGISKEIEGNFFYGDNKFTQDPATEKFADFPTKVTGTLYYS